MAVGLDEPEAELRCTRELLGMRAIFLLVRSLCLASEMKISGRDRLYRFYVKHRETNFSFGHRAEVTVNTNRNYVHFRGLISSP